MKKYSFLLLLNSVGLLFFGLNILFDFIVLEGKITNPIMGVILSLTMIVLSFKLNVNKKKLNE